jgi:DNA-binding GntR family transcriptional regulator
VDPLRLVPNLIEQVHARMVDAIAEGELAPGDRLNQEDVAKRLNVSRQPVSHALQLLKRQGLVVEQGRRGLSVAPIEAARMRDLYQLRAAIDGLAARLAAERVAHREASKADVDRLVQRLATGSDLAPEASIHDWIETDVAFHESIYRLSGNHAIAETITELWPHFKRCMGTSLADIEVRAAIWAEHAAIADGILTGATRAAESAALHHAEKAGAALYRRLSEEAVTAGAVRRA